MKIIAGPSGTDYKFKLGKCLQSIKPRVFSVLGIQKHYADVLCLYKTCIKF